MDDGYPPYSIVLFLLFLILEAMFYGFGAAIQNVNESSLEKEKEQGGKRAGQLLQLIGQPAKLVNSIQIAAHAISMLTGAFVLLDLGGRLEHFMQSHTQLGAGWAAAGCLRPICLAVTGFVLITCFVAFGVIVPKRCAIKNPEKWSCALWPFVQAVMTVFAPLIAINIFLARAVLKILRTDINISDNVTEEDIVSMVNEGHEQGVLAASEAEMITNIFELDDKEAGDIMTHRKNIAAIDSEMTLKDAIDFILTVGTNSRYPVYQGDVDDIIGILHMKDAMIFAEKQGRLEQPVGQISGLLREAYFIPETRSLTSLFKEMQSRKVHMAVVVDEYGQTAGIITMEDILEEIVGNILDEYDEEEEDSVVREDDGFVISGMASLEEVEDALSIEFPEEDRDSFDTISGYLISRLNRIPGEDEKPEVEALGYCFRFEQTEDKMIRTVKAAPIPAEAGE